MIKAVIFDLDGTLVDTIDDIAAAVNAALEKFGFPPRRREELYRMVGNGMRNLARRAVPEGVEDPEVIDGCVAEAVERYAEKPAVFTRPYPGVDELLAELRRRRIPSAILSNKPHPLTVLVVDAVFPGHAFRVVQGEKPGVPRKPDPSAPLAIAAELGAAPEEVLYLGDSDVDVHTARAAGFYPVGAAWGFRGRDELREAGAEAIVEAPLDLLSLLDSPAI